MNERSIFKSCLWAAVGFSLSIAAMEILLHGIEHTPAWRVLPVVERELGWPDPDTGYALRPGREIINVRENRARVTTNELGMRDQTRALAKPRGTYRVVLTGDSFTEALQVDDEDTFARRAEDLLNSENSSRDFEILNFGMSGAGPVQQFLRARQAARDFAPDAIVMLIDANQFLTAEMSDDSMNPAYVANRDGSLELGYAFRARRSQRYRDSPIGELFFGLMDYSRVARAAYLHYVYGGSSAPGPAQTHALVTLRSCTPTKAGLSRHLTLWQPAERTDAAARLVRFLDDVGAITEATALPIAIVLYGIGEPRQECPQASRLRAHLIQEMKRTFGQHGLQFRDADAAIAARLAPGEPLSRLHGFGRRVGVGHLNLDGHHAYGTLLTDLVEAFALAPVTPGSD